MRWMWTGNWAAWALLGAVLWGLGPRTAEACSRRLPSLMISPGDSTEGVPLNVEPVISTSAMFGFTSVTLCMDVGDGLRTPVETRLERIGSRHARLVPHALLRPETDYELSDASDCYGVAVGRFTTGTTEDTTPPEFPGVTAVIEDAYSAPLIGDDCATASYAYYRLDMPDARDAESGEQVLLLVYEGPSIDTVDLTRPVLGLETGERELKGSLSPDNRDNLAVVVTALDWAGNESAQQAPVLAQNRACGCRGGGAGGLGALGLLLMPLLGRRGASPGAHQEPAGS
jgi:hypothetical protein